MWRPWDLRLQSGRSSGSGRAPAVQSILTERTRVTFIANEGHPSTSRSGGGTGRGRDGAQGEGGDSATGSSSSNGGLLGRPSGATTASEDSNSSGSGPAGADDASMSGHDRDACRRPGVRRGVCLLRFDPWTGAGASLVIEGPRLSLRTAEAAASPTGCDGGGDTTLLRFRRSRRGHESSAHDVDVDADECDGGGPATSLRHVYSTRWAVAASSVLGADTAAGTVSSLLGVLPCGGAAGGPATAVTVLGPQHLFLVDLTTAGMGAVSDIVLGQSMSVSATAMDAHGPHCTLVGFSSGQLSVYDWRVRRHGGSGVSRPALTLATVPQPLWLLPSGTQAARRRRLGIAAAGEATSAGVLSCCSLEGSWRAICGLADARGAVVVADLRMAASAATSPSAMGATTSGPGPVTASASAFRAAAAVAPTTLNWLVTRKRYRLSPAEAAMKDLLDGHYTVATGAAIASMAASPAGFGVIGMVDARGRPVLTSIAALEGGTVQTGYGPDEATGLDELFESAGEVTATRTAAARPLPSPQEVLQRLRGSRARLPSRAASALLPIRTPTATASALPPPSLQHRCCFAADGAAFIHSHYAGATTAASFLATGLGARPVDWANGDGQTLLLPSDRGSRLFSGGGGTAANGISAVAALGETVCLETDSGHSLCLVLDL